MHIVFDNDKIVIEECSSKKGYKMLSEAIVNKIKRLCQEKNISINQLAYKSYLSQSTLQSIMSGTTKNPKIITLILICYGFGITLQEFFSDKIFQNISIEHFI